MLETNALEETLSGQVRRSMESFAAICPQAMVDFEIAQCIRYFEKSG